ncbi:hypothetical protein DEU56DRAFT_820196 [Suillus clintonianus]|uniref:uncharacterized protein n=1 Tax=Suillus clintonianus TaxID=1904413 RepID=UPI001B85E58B|nr:uncharacterized protein DEU56DRAFT_820196 [Suillus clintonianus]KAG2127705.1 hypothetical protein DEU56DRAFT_820196 [Suillus clintonianus]
MAGKSKNPKISLPEIPWSEDDHSRVWKLIAELSQKANYKVLFGKKDQHENTSGETKASVYKRIGAVVLPEFHEIDPTATGDRVKGKLESLTKTYKKHAAKLRNPGLRRL